MTIDVCTSFIMLRSYMSNSRGSQFFTTTQCVSPLTYRASADSLLPKGLAEETLQTLALLFPSSDVETRKWFSKLSDAGLNKRAIQCGQLKTDHRQTERFRFWNDRLVVLKQVFDEAQPKSLSQWWHDRRNGVQWYRSSIANLPNAHCHPLIPVSPTGTHSG